MAKLTDTQLIVLSKAAARDDGAATVPDGLNKVAAEKVGTSLVSRKLMREVQSKPGMPVWKENEEGRRTSLIITRDGRAAIGLDEETNEGAQEPTASKNDRGGYKRRSIAQRKHAEKVIEPRPGSKQALVVKMVSRKSGATLDALTDATGWLPHTARAALTGLRKRGYALTLERQSGKASVYRIGVAPSRAAA
jgi:hypothetical protein